MPPSIHGAAPDAGSVRPISHRDRVRMQRLLFLHANGYPSAVYRQFLDGLRPVYDVRAPDVLSTPADTPPGRRWATMRQQVAALVDTEAPDVLCGHSMGGYLALCAAADRLPARTQVVMVDSPIPSVMNSALLTVAKRIGLSTRVGPAPIAARRRDRWPSTHDARHHFAGKDFVRRWAPGVLDDFIAHALAPGEDAVRLRIPREEERDIYAHLPHEAAIRAHARLRRAGIRVGFVAGTYSRELAMAGMTANRRRFGGHWITLPTGHLVPMEAPAACADAVLKLLGHGAESATAA